MANGVSFVQEGSDVGSAVDSQKVIDTRWRYFDIKTEKKLSFGTMTGKNVLLYEHNLGYAPAFDCYNTTLNAYMEGSVNSSGVASELFANKTHIIFNGNFGTGSYSSTQALLRIYNVPFTETYQAPIVKTFPGGKSRIGKFGVKFTNIPDGFRSEELSKYTLNTKGKSLAIHKTGIAIANSGTGNLAVITHDIGYPPTYLTASCDARGELVGAINPSFVPVISNANDKTITFRGAQAALDGNYAYIIFKELGDFAI